MDVTVLLGPAGGGKTYRCLKEAREALKRSPEGLPLLFLTPKQSTYQIERELLCDPALPGFTRLQVLSFEAVAQLIVAETTLARDAVLSEQGRVMILRALLAAGQAGLRTFHGATRLSGFAQELSLTLNELQRARLTPELLRLAATRDGVGMGLHDKLLDLALLLERYTGWLQDNGLYDAGRLLRVAAEALQSPQTGSSIRFGRLWLDGFAELSEGELELLAALIQRSDSATLAFCAEQCAVDPPWHSIWAHASRTVRRMRTRLESLARLELVELKREPRHGRFVDPGLRHLEAQWTTGRPADPAGSAHETLPLFPAAPAVKILRCRNPFEEAAVCAREILTFVRDEKRRFRDVAVLVRSLSGYDHAIARVFARYEIPYFLDRREPVAHHPLTELVRYALRLPVHGWAREDWVGALKTGLLGVEEDAIDGLENEALAGGWDGEAWLKPFPPAYERYRKAFAPPLVSFAEKVQGQGTGPQLSAALRKLFADFDVVGTLQQWSTTMEGERAEGSRGRLLRAEIHTAVWNVIEEWLEAVEMAFANCALRAADWLPIVEAGLANLTVGVIPPALDQVLIGAVDRSRNPDLRMTIVMGLNETIFPAAPAEPGLLTEYDREMLRATGVHLGKTPQEQLGLEQYLAYIACTRARERLVLTYAERDSQDKALNPSSIVQHVRDLLPEVAEEQPNFLWERDAAHYSDVLVPLLKEEWQWPTAPVQNPLCTELLAQFQRFQSTRDANSLPPTVVQQLYGPELHVSVSQLEDYAACAFKFFVRRGLRAEERKEFRVDHRLAGIFQHEVLQRFHESVMAQGKRWRDLKPAEARALVRELGRRVQDELEGGIFAARPEWRFLAESLLEGLERLVAVLVGWAPQYEFQPQAVELGFGESRDSLPPWKIDLGDGRVLALRGRVDRVDLDRGDDGSAWVVVMDYKAGGQELDETRLCNGLDLQLIAYLAALRHLPEARVLLECGALRPAGGFYLRLRSAKRCARSREEALQLSPQLYQHVGRFRGDLITRFDNRGEPRGDQFNFRLTKADELYKNCKEAMEPAAFEDLVAVTEGLLRQFGQAISDGHVAVNPFRHKQHTACARCDYKSICRFDAWTQPFRALTRP